MSIYNIVLFVHVIGAIGYFLGMGILLFILLGLRRAQRVEHVRALIHLNDLSAPVSAASAVLLLVTGLYLALTAWSLLTSWILVALISLLLMVPTSAVLIAPRRSAIVKQLAREAPDGELSEAQERHIDDPVLATVCTTVAALLLGLVFLMTTKPNLVGSLIVIVVALLLGLAAGVLVSRMRRAPEPGMVDQRAQDQEPIG
jgi:small-conductance mechanosensitive channel